MEDDEINVYNPIYKSKAIGEFQLYVEINSFESKTVQKEDIIFYNVELYSYLTDREWTVPHRYIDFYELYVVLSGHFIDVPCVPNRSLGKLTNITELNKRKESLSNFMKDVINRSDLISNIYTIKFLRLDNHFPDFNIFQPLLLINLDNINQILSPSAFYFHNKTSLLFIGLSNTTISGKINSYISKIFTRNKSDVTNTEYPGCIMIYNLIKNNTGIQHLELIYERGLNSEVTSINFYDVKNILCVGTKNGNISLNKVYINESSCISTEFVEEICTVKASKNSIIGVCINFSQGYVYSVAKDKAVTISEINYQSIIRTIPITKKDISCMHYDEIWGRLFLGDDSGSIWILDILSNPLQPKVLQALHNQLVNISVIDFDLDKNILLLGNKNGIVICYELENYNEKIIPQYQNLSNIVMKKILEIKTNQSLKILALKYTSKKELLVGMSNGSVAVYSHDKIYPEYVVEAHSAAVIGFWWDEEKKMLVTASQDKSIKLFQFPIFWPSEIIRRSTRKNKVSLISDKHEDNKEKNEREEKEIFAEIKNKFGDENEQNAGNETEENNAYHKSDKILEIEGKKKELKKLNDEEINCIDLDGWDTAFE